MRHYVAKSYFETYKSYDHIIFGSLPQIWVNCKFQIWGNDPNLGQKLIFKSEIQWESNSSLSHNYSRTWPKHSRIFICVSLTTTIRSHRNMKKKHVLDNKNFSKYGKLTLIWSDFLMKKFWPKFGAIPQLLGWVKTIMCFFGMIQHPETS